MSDSLHDPCMPTLPFFEDLLLFVPKSLSIAGFFHRDKANTPATAACKKKLLIILIIIILIIFINCSWVVTQWQWSFYIV